MTSKQPKKPAKKNTSNKKAPAKKAKKVTPKAKPSFKPDAKDGDADGIVQDGTSWARPATATETVKINVAVAPKKKSLWRRILGFGF